MARGRVCLVLRHLAFEDLGRFGPAIEEAGYRIAYHEVGVGQIDTAAVTSADLLVVLGGPIGVHEADRYPFLTAETAAIKTRLATGHATLGICLGHQLIAAALGAKVAPGRAKEIGWGPLRLTPEGRASVLGPIGDAPVLHWHGDEAALPKGAVRLAETDACANQAFAIGCTVLALQFHIEVDPARIEQWLIGHTAELGAARIDPRTIRADTIKHGPRMAAVGKEVIERWLAELPR